jgi:monooxygenase
MLQRSPSYILSLPGSDPVANFFRRLLPSKLAYSIVRWKNVLITMLFFQLSRAKPRFVSKLIRKGVEKELPPGYDIDTHFKPRYNPWDQRVCLVPDGDLFEAIRAGSASVVTDRIETFTETGLELESGAELEADLIVTATGLNLLALGGMQVVVDGTEVELPETVGYKGMMLAGVPNLAVAFGYTNASWTLKCDLTCAYVCRLLNHMDAQGYRQCTPVNRNPDLPTQPFIDFSSGYVQRAISQFPRQGLKAPWRLYQNYLRDIVMLRYGSLDDEAMEFSNRTPAVEPEERIAA